MLIFEEREKAEFSGQSSETIKSTRMKGRRGQQIERLYNMIMTTKFGNISPEVSSSSTGLDFLG